ncbi:chaperone NapD [Sulfitobacter sp. D35]|uniref:chaperone NapD n=1 Tax=Sulfitobacter sp. D35 TaxID=3083252 RepID=UPI00296ED401|nr:chaperone NapD [Sulfitobacter sp. D35]MDW4498495.1 chaperone NapD [Sulfitobacter sp. D35]
MSATRHISSLVLRCHPARLEAVQTAVLQIANTEIAIADRGGRIVVTMETDGEGEIADALTRMQLMDGVANAALVFHQIERAADLEATQGEPS